MNYHELPARRPPCERSGHRESANPPPHAPCHRRRRRLLWCGVCARVHVCGGRIKSVYVFPPQNDVPTRLPCRLSARALAPRRTEFMWQFKWNSRELPWKPLAVSAALVKRRQAKTSYEIRLRIASMEKWIFHTSIFISPGALFFRHGFFFSTPDTGWAVGCGCVSRCHFPFSEALSNIRATKKSLLFYCMHKKWVCDCVLRGLVVVEAEVGGDFDFFPFRSRSAWLNQNTPVAAISARFPGLLRTKAAHESEQKLIARAGPRRKSALIPA